MHTIKFILYVDNFIFLCLIGLVLRIDNHNSEEDVGHDKTRKEIPENSDNDPLTKFHHRWNTIFLILSEFALFLDHL